MKKIIIFAFILIVVAFGIGAGLGISNFFQPTPGEKQVLNARENVQNPPTAAPEENFEQPQTISIPKINVNAPIESVGLDAKSNMDVPKNADNGAWYNLGYKPGQKGNAVIAGHYDKVDGSPAIFWDLTKLTAGDKIIVTDIAGKERTFEVVTIEKYPYDNFPLQKVFGDSDEAMLNLITCVGDWNSATGMYSHRNVVYSRLVN